MTATSKLNRRALLKVGAFGATNLCAPAGLGSILHSARSNQTKRVIVIAFAGGVRTKETLGTPENVPNLMQMVKDGVLYPRTRATNLGHFGAALSIFTGVSEAHGIRENARGGDPTLFEYLRKDLGWGPSDVWVSTSGGVQEANISYSLHPDYGERYGANTLDGDGVFNEEFKGILDVYGRPREMDAKEVALLERMRSSIGVDGTTAINDPESSTRVERFLLEELKRGTQDLRGVGAADAKALRVGRNLLAVFRPKLLAIVLRDADLAHGSFSSYVQVLHRNDEMLGQLWETVREDRDLANSTAVFVLPEFGRDADLNSRRGLDHGDGSEDLKYVSMICWGPDFRHAESVQEEVRTIDLCNTVCEIFGANPREARGRCLPRLFG